jgi:uncharacterized protein YjcR
MRRPSHKQLQRLAEAARLYVSSMSWEAVAQAVGCRPEVCRRWPQKYPEEWGRFCAEAQQRRYEHTNRLALETIRKLSRSAEPETRRKGERLLAEFRRRFPEAFRNSEGEALGAADY